MAQASRHRPVGSFLTRSRPSARPALEALEVRLAPAAAFVVDRSSDVAADGSGFDGSLRYCLSKANTGDTISIVTTQPIVLMTQLVISNDVTIVGSSPSGLSLIERDVANPSLFGLFDITSNAGNVTLTNLELTGGHAQSNGGAVSNAANLTLQDCWIHGNAADASGGGVYSGGGFYSMTTGMLTIADCTFQANSVAKGGNGGGIFVGSVNLFVTGTTFQGDQADKGGGVYVQGFGTAVKLDFLNCTFSGNQATTGDGGALATYGGEVPITLSFYDCTLADNTSAGIAKVGGAFAYSGGGRTYFTYQGTLFANNGGASLGGQGVSGSDYFFTSLGNNLSTDGTGNLVGPGDLPNVAAPDLGPLGYYGGPTPTILLLAGSPAIDAGVVIAGIGTDQRGVARPQGAVPDIGAFEVRPQRIALATGDQFANVGVAFSRGGSVTGDGNATVYVDYGDGSGVSPVVSNPDFTLSHAYTAEGTYVVTVSLIDSTGKTLDTLHFQVDVFLDGVDTTQIHEQTTSGPGVVTVQTTDLADGSSVTATLLHVSDTTASLLVAIVPASVAAALNGSSQIAGNTIASAYDVRAVGVGIDDKILVVFHYTSNNLDQPVLRYYIRATGQEGVVSTDTYIVDPAAKTITLVLDAGSTPGILDISGTVFTIAVPLAVSVSPDPTLGSALGSGGSGGGGFGAGSDAGASGSIPGSFQVTGNTTFVLFASLTALTGPLEDDFFAGRSSISDRAKLLADLPIVPDSLITLPGPILTPGSAETPVPDDPSKPSTPARGGSPPTSRLDDSGADAVDEAFAHFGDGRLALRLYSLPSWTVEGEADAPVDWCDTSLAIVAFLAARPAVPRRRSFANAPDEN